MPGTYSDGNKCLTCHHSCATCRTEVDCLTCNKGFYEDNGKCVTENECSGNTYPNSNTMACEGCGVACLTCYGATSKHCLECNYKIGYSMAEESSRACYLKECLYGSYLSLDDTGLYCLQCNFPCKICTSDGRCVECQEDFFSFLLEGNYVSCEKCPSGYSPTSEGTCEGIIWLTIRNMWGWIEPRCS